MRIAGSRVLITGGAGFIGSHLTESLVSAGAKVRIFDNFSSGLRENLAHVKDDVEVVTGDILDADALGRAMKGCDVVSHQAAQLEITHCIDDPIDDLRTNTVGTLNVYIAAKNNGVQKILNASSACVYGQAVDPPSHEDRSPTNPNWAYGASKLVAEKYGKIWTDFHKIPVVSFRYAIVYGEREWYGRVLTIFLKRILEGKAPVVFGGGDQIRDFTYVGDLVRLHNAAFESDAANGEVFNVSTAAATTVKELSALVCEVTATPLKPIFEDIPVGGRSAQVDGRMRLPSELKEMHLDNAKAKRILGWTPAVTPREGIAREWAWLREHAARWQKMSY
ncbi:MAG: SDR family oxidoreductase [Polyangiales bacterium]